MTSGEFQLNFVNRISFNRYGGTEDELRAANIILDELKALGGEGHIEEFKVPAYKVSRAKFTITEPFEREIKVHGVGRTGQTPVDGIEAELLYVENAEEYDLRDAKGKIILTNRTGYEPYKRIVQSGALGFIVFSGQFCDDPKNTDLEMRMFRPIHCENGTIPGVSMRTADAIHMIQDGAKKVRMTVRQKEFDNTSRNVVAFIEGTEFPDEEMVMTAHYDSTIYGLGSWDNASGSANLLWMYKHFLENPPKRSIRFIWCGSEEQGLLGSKAYSNAHEDEVEKMYFCINFDMTGTTLGAGQTFITGTPALKDYVVSLTRELGYTGEIMDRIHSSDSAPFCLMGVPAVGIARSGQAGGHSRFDIPWPLCASALERATDFAIVLAERFLNSKIPPVAKEISPDNQEKVKNYFLYGKKIDK